MIREKSIPFLYFKSGSANLSVCSSQAGQWTTDLGYTLFGPNVSHCIPFNGCMRSLQVKCNKLSCESQSRSLTKWPRLTLTLNTIQVAGYNASDSARLKGSTRWTTQTAWSDYPSSLVKTVFLVGLPLEIYSQSGRDQEQTETPSRNLPW